MPVQHAKQQGVIQPDVLVCIGVCLVLSAAYIGRPQPLAPSFTRVGPRSGTVQYTTLRAALA